jgi:class 3 adenylate cyclase
MSEHSLKSLSRLAFQVGEITARLGPTEAEGVRALVRRALGGQELAEDSLRGILAEHAELLAEEVAHLAEAAEGRPGAEAGARDGEAGEGLAEGPRAAAAVVEAAVARIRELVAAHQVLLPAVLSAAERGDARLLSLPDEELGELVSMWAEAAHLAGPREARAFASLFSLLAERGAPSVAGTVGRVLRRIVLDGPAVAGDAALPGLLRLSRVRATDRRFFRRVDLQLAVHRLGPGAAEALGRWLWQGDEVWPTLVAEGSQAGLRQRVRAQRWLELAVAAALGPASAPGAGGEPPAEAGGGRHLDEARAIARAGLADPAPLVAYAAARGLARLTPAGGLDELWEPWFAEDAHRAWLPRAAAGLGALWEVDPDRAAEYLETVTTFAHDDAAEAARRRPWLVALADAHEDIAQVASEAAAQLRRALLTAADPEALWRLADRLALQRLRGEGSEGPERSACSEAVAAIDQALGAPTQHTPAQWARVLAARQCLVMARGRSPRASYVLQSRLLAARMLRAEPVGRLLTEITDLLEGITERVQELARPLGSEDTVVLGTRLYEAEDLLRALYTEEVLTGLLRVIPARDPETVAAQRRRLEQLRRELRLTLLGQASAPEAGPRWRRHALLLSAALTQCVPDDPLGRPSAPRSAGFEHLVALPDLLRGWGGREDEGGASAGAEGSPEPTEGLEPALGRALDAVLSAGTPGSGDALATLLLWARDAASVRRLLSHLGTSGALERVERIALLLEGVPEADAAADERLTAQLVATEDLLDVVLEETAFAAPRIGDALQELRRHVRTASGHERLISFMTPVRRSLEEAAEPLLVVLARDLGALRRIAQEGASHARLVALRAIGAQESALAAAAGQQVSHATLDSASFEAEAVVLAEEVGDAVRRGAAAGPEARAERSEALGEAAAGLRALSAHVRDGVSGCFGALLAGLLESWAALITQRREQTAEEPAHPLLIDRFRIDRLLGEGGMAYTYLARDPDLERSVTLKVIKPEIQQRPELQRLFAAEAKALAALPPHAHVVQAFEYLDAASGPCLVIEYVDGESLVDLIPEGGMPLKAGLELAVAAAQGLHHVHRHHLVHLDVKAENVMVTREGTAKLIDFGLAQRDTAGRESKMVLGTPVYMSPEQALGRALGPASDVYSFGVLLYELFTGEVPFDDADPREILKAHVKRPPPALSVLRPDLPDGLVLLVADTLQKSSDHRPWMVEVASRLARIQSGLQPVEGEVSDLIRREIAVLCVALRGLDLKGAAADDTARIVEGFLGAAAEIVTSLGGRVDATVGERVFAVFGYPRDDAQAVLHGVRAAVQLDRRLQRLHRGVRVSGGVASGPALVGQVRGDPTDATVLGSPLWHAARLVDEAGDGARVLVDEPSLDRIRGLVAVGKRRNLRGFGRAWDVSLQDGASG